MGQRRPGGATVVAALVGLCALAGCSNSHGDAVGHPTTTSASSSTTTSTTAASSATITTPTARGISFATVHRVRPKPWVKA